MDEKESQCFDIQLPPDVALFKEQMEQISVSFGGVGIYPVL